MAQPGSALAWGARGRVFESLRPDQENQKTVGVFCTSGFFVFDDKVMFAYDCDGVTPAPNAKIRLSSMC